jgi:hypothetical protein
LTTKFFVGADILLFCATAVPFLGGSPEGDEPRALTAVLAAAFAVLFAVADLDANFTETLLWALVFLAAPVFLAPVLPAALAALFVGRLAIFPVAIFADSLAEDALRCVELLRAADASALPRTLLLRELLGEAAGFLTVLADCPRCSAKAPAFEFLEDFLIDGIRVTLPYRPALDTGQTSRPSSAIPLYRIGLAALREHRIDES